MKNIDVKKLIILNLPLVLFFYLADKAGQAFRLAAGADISAKVLHLSGGFAAAFENPLPSFHTQDLLVGIIGAALIKLALQIKKANAKKFRKGIEYGSARWGSPADIAPYISPVFENNVLLTQTERLTMESRPKNPAFARNKNVMVIGGSGSGKTRFYVKPQLMQMHSSYCCTDPKGTILIECGKLLQRGGYDIRVLNMINFAKSMKYNPFEYIRSEKDILKLVNTLIANTKVLDCYGEWLPLNQNHSGLGICGTDHEHSPKIQTRKEFATMNINYIEVGDYLLPAVRLSDPPDAPLLGQVWASKQGVPAEREIRAVFVAVTVGTVVPYLP
jgi:hypothetical protein